MAFPLADPELPVPESLTLMCPVCHERFTVQPEDEPQMTACTFCATPVAVPSLAQARERKAGAQIFPLPTVEEYDLAPSALLTQTKPARRLTRSDADPVEGIAPGSLISLECPTCHEFIRARVEATPGRAPCPYCGAMTSVPDRQTAAGWEMKKIEPRPPAEIGEFAAGAPQPTPEFHPGGLFDKLAEVRREVAPPPPRWTFFSGVFTFPWRNDAFSRWCYATLGFTAIAVIGLVVRGIAASFSGIGSGVALAFFSLPMIWIGFFTLSYSAACGIGILESTAAGLDNIEGWPEPNWKEWMGQMLYLGWIGTIPLVVSFGLAKLAELAGGRVEWILPGVLFFLYPVSLLSALEANSSWAPFTLPILMSLIRWWWGWLMFYLLTGFLAAGLAAIAVLSVATSNDFFLLGLGPLVAAAVFIYFRLLGRLAWRMTTKMRMI
jgi:hypothetical protein